MLTFSPVAAGTGTGRWGWMRLRPGHKTERVEWSATETASADAARSVAGAEVPTSPQSRPRLGELLVTRGAISQEDLAQALLEHTDSGKLLGEVLIEHGLLKERQLLEVLSEQLHMPIVDLRNVIPAPDALDALSESVVRAVSALPLQLSDEGLVVAMAGPPTPAQLHELESAAGRPVSVVLAPGSDVRTLIDRSYRALADVDWLVNAFAGAEAGRIGSTVIGAPGDASSPVAQLIGRILTEAVRERASDIHIEPQEHEVRVRFRVDGALHDATQLPANMAQALVSRIKIMSDMNIVERRRSQDGQFEAEVDGRGLDVRVATMATIWGEKVVLRILNKNRELLELSRLGMSRDTREEFEKLVRAPFGMVLCAGPTGSGKTTTLYAVLNQIADVARNVTTIEDPVEYVFPSINQIQINEQADITFAGGLKAILRQDPDVILVGEIRDVETARIAVQSALTGHLVLSSLHATDATAALHRFLDMGIESFLIASSVIGIVAQRLVRRICNACREEYEPSPDELAFYEQWGGKPKDVFTHGVGCNFCSQTGYVERVGVYELLRVSPAMKQLIVDRATHDELRELAISEGMRTLRDEALRVIEEDNTTIGEVLRSVYIA
jgi:type IV pilus assembly protein PilB